MSNSNQPRKLEPKDQPQQPSNSLINLLVIIIIKLIRADLIHSALFYSERLHALIPSSELSIWLLALCLLRSGDHQATVHLLTNAPVLVPIPPSNHNRFDPKGKGKLLDDDPFNFHHPSPTHKNQPIQIQNTSPQKCTQRPANLASARCALVYSKACSLIDRPKEGLEVYLRAIEEFGISSPDEVALLNSTSNSDQSTSSAYTHLATLSYKCHEYEKANSFYRKALKSKPDGHLCWEAFEGLCQTVRVDEDLDPEQLFSPTDLEEYLTGYMDLDDDRILFFSNASTSLQQINSLPLVSNAPIKPKPPPLAPKDAFRIMGTNGLHRHKQFFLDNSFGDSSHNSSIVNSFDRPCYAPKMNQRGTSPFKSNIHHKVEPVVSTPNLNRANPLPRSFNFALGDPPRSRVGGMAFDPQVPLSSTPNFRHGFEFSQFSCSNPPIPMPDPSPVPFNLASRNAGDYIDPQPAQQSSPGGGSRGALGGRTKRTRSQTQSQDLSRSSTGGGGGLLTTSAITTELDSHSTNTHSDPNSKSIRDESAKNVNGKPIPRREVLENNGGLLKATGGARSTKRAKSNSDLIMPDQGPSTPQFPRLGRSEPLNLTLTGLATSSTSPTNSNLNNSKFRKEKLEAIDWVKDVTTKLANAYLNLSRFKCEIVLNELLALPDEQKKSWRVYCLIGRARFEMLDYKSAEIAFRKAREAFPHLVTHMDIYSTLLWHLRKTTTLSYLSQELQLINPNAPETWIATGNLFSRLDDHPNALKCFQRSTQLNKTYEYGYTLSGHECLMLEEFQRSLNFFRESLRRNSWKNFNAYFGMGECYFKQDRFKLAEFFFNRALKINPTNPLILCAIAKVFESNHQFIEALKIYNRAVKLANSCVANVRFSRAKVLFGLGQFEDAKEDLIKLVDLVPTEFNVRFLLGKIYGKLNDRRECIKHLTYAQDLEPKSIGLIKKILNDLNLS